MNLRYLRTIDWTFVVIPLLLVAFGIAILYSFSFSGQKNLAVLSAVYALLGFLAMVFLALLDYRTLKNLSPYIYILMLFLLILVLVIGSQVFGARRWLDFGVFQLQPSELMKLVLILLLARIAPADGQMSIRRLVLIGLAVLIPFILVLNQPDLGTAGVIAVISLAMVAHTKPPRWFWPAFIVIGLVAAPTVWSQLKPYQKQRLSTFIQPASDPSGVGYNVAQSKIAVGAGGIWGRGLGQGSQSQLNFLPVAHTDFIFAAIAEASGFIGSVVLIGLYVILIWRALHASMLSQDSYGRFVALGIATMFLFQSGVNIGMNIGIFPVTGIPLPFVSFGGSGMITNFAAVGILQSIYIRHKKIRFG